MTRTLTADYGYIRKGTILTKAGQKWYPETPLAIEANVCFTEEQIKPISTGGEHEEIHTN